MNPEQHQASSGRFPNEAAMGVGDGVVVFVGCKVVGEWVMEVAGKRGRMNSIFDFGDMDNIGATPAGIIRSTLRGPLEVDVETPRTGTNLSAWEHIEGHLSALKSLLKEHNGKGNVSPIHLSFADEAVKTLLTRRIIEFASPEFKMPTNIKVYDGPPTGGSPQSILIRSKLWGMAMPVWCHMFQQTLDGSARGWFKNLPQGSINRWVELRQQFTTKLSTRRACFKDPTKITKIIMNANETLVAFKEMWIIETGFIMGVPEVIKISSFMDAYKFPELAKRYSIKVPKTMDEMRIRLDDFVRLEEAFASTELPKGEASRPFGNSVRKRTLHQRLFSAKEETRNGLELRKLNHLIKDVRHRGRGAKGTDVGKEKVINMIRSWPNNRKRKSVKRDKSWMKAPIMFPPLSMKDASDEPLIIEAVMEGYLVRRVYVDQGASVEVMFEHCFENLSPAIKSRLRDTQMDLVGLAGGVDRFNIPPCGFLDNTLHGKIPHPKGVATLVTRSAIIFECWRLERKQMVEQEVNQNVNQEKKVSTRVDLIEKASVNPVYLDQVITIEGSLSEQCKNQLRTLLKESMDVFAWEPADMIGIPRRVIKHSLNVNPSMEPIAQKRRVIAFDRTQSVSKDVEEWIESNLEAYMDDMVIKSNDEKILIKDIAETFDNLWRINMKLNLRKCSFGVEEGKFLGYMVTSKGIRANQKKTKAIADMHSPWTLKEMQSQSGKLAALKRFLSQSTKKSLHVFKILKDITKENRDEYRWTKNAEKAFQEMKKVIVELPLLTTRVEEEMLYVYVAAATEAETAKASGKLAKCSVELRAYNIAYEPRSAMKGQVLTDFLSEVPKPEPKGRHLSKLATIAFDHLTKKVLVEVLAERSIDQKEVRVIMEEEEDNWITPIVHCLADGAWPIGKDERRALVMKINQDARKVTQKCDLWQVHALVPRHPKTLMTSIIAPWPFYQWGMDIHGPLPQASRKLKFVIVAIDYFTKWIEANPLARITSKDVKKFVWENIVCQFGLPRINMTVAHPHANGLVERANKSLMEGIKARLGRERAGWVDELPNVLWAHCTSLKQSNDETPFSLTYRSEVMISAEIGMPTHQTMMIKEDVNDDELRLNTNILQERREATAIREAKYKTKME
uniref:Reverse transcriptase domain-containing protein n=1 Tax=Tanacetum cinerariifolium TaxID=118510 RepID=A0A6L2JGG8_TANCI|nr:reverse transcriptase domain-containing protein [Tanacetum cinerariifolium]